MFKRIDHVEIIPSDFETSLKFYTEVLGFTIKSRMPVPVPPLEEVAYLELGGTVLEFMRVPDAKKSTDPGPWITGYGKIALEVENMDKAIEYLASKGVVVTWGPMNIGPTTRRAEIQDPDGFSIELRQW